MTAQLADEASIVDRILRHIDAKSTDLSDGIWHEPVAHYLAQDRFAAEIEHVFRRTLTPFCPSAALAEIGAYVARDAALTPVVAIRGADGVARAFRNACRHRGVQLVDGAGCKKALTCRYHGWTYGLDGRLRRIPDDYGFPGLDKDTHGLVPVTCIERDGLVFVSQDDPAATSEAGGMPTLFGDDWKLYATTAQEVEANWKIVAEGFLEGYHIRSTHQDTFYPLQYDNLNVIEPFGRNSRISFPYRRIEKLRNVPPGERRTAGMLTHVYHLFPNVMLSTFPTNRLMTVLEPLAVDRTRLVTYTLSNQIAAEDGRTAVAQGRDFVTAGAAEDREMACAAQRGLATRANAQFTFGLFEGAIRHFHQNLAAIIESRTGAR
ncbi:phenylpropionate dioxygenase-like ring-hydroxylating dioxygenase large terminal subunit [Bradyrhizobium japonicum]|uniref:Phenylpropionate dioxygenase-like ring-hydroxylating dioxygenase large terminal subunit n=1 Tax=Bradyrhizobium elkanii TaxID=29448 RepID=A0ABV4EW07_BRAEL|nr:SRPBCC family protein [Bradyrhizobium elkanii]MBP2428481.1 phenylpropionate dioxygenase-like ring-hydroxylating dioxygenase large terminal subunit [Bradyrhizobium elkanii]MCP1729301.1 phenylpropionate dioxygenase-like ring-hydroxylating dioxygenase large terminal subunit [Bradyrhizobium elkanii]MCP1756035.1 phenylpropionate dioxygenase-like ring-hydroxylating dioxygenase large terminal subunit [Bradyrhizobium elkanii]MCP1981550.1 phenylpropionate dioxygenase-like ring-hydroxylating dioxygena